MSSTQASAIPPFVTEPIRLADVVTVMEVMDDVNPVHIDAELVQSLGLRGLVNQGPANLGYVVNMLLAWAGAPGALRRLRFRFHSISCPGDRLTARAQITAIDPHDRCRVTTSFTLEQEDGVLVCDGTADLQLPEPREG